MFEGVNFTLRHSWSTPLIKNVFGTKQWKLTLATVNVVESIEKGGTKF